MRSSSSTQRPRSRRRPTCGSTALGQSRDGFAFLLEGGISEFGHLAVCTPGSVKGYDHALSRYGTMDWADVIAPAIAQARSGVMVRPHMHWFWSQDQKGSGQVNTGDKFATADPASLFPPDGSLKRVGDPHRQPDMANTLERLAKGGADLFYHGELAEQIAADFAGPWRPDLETRTWRPTSSRSPSRSGAPIAAIASRPARRRRAAC
jgi:hypothetical protein